MGNHAFGYPRECTRCANIEGNRVNLSVEPYFRNGGGVRLMLIGQDPTIARNPERVKQVLMLDEPRGQLTRWLTAVFGKEVYQTLTLYATNLVKCGFNVLPSAAPEGNVRYLRPYFENCRNHLAREISEFRPSLVITLGEPAHGLFLGILDNHNEIPSTMQEAFTGRFLSARLAGLQFHYSPCLHIKTFRVAETYGASVQGFKKGLRAYLVEAEDTGAS